MKYEIWQSGMAYPEPRPFWFWLCEKFGRPESDVFGPYVSEKDARLTAEAMIEEGEK